MRVLHTLHWVQFAGTEKVCVDLCNQMSLMGHEVFLLTQNRIKPYINERVNLVEFDFENNRYNPIFLYKTAQILRQILPDIIHCHNTKELEIMHHAQIFLRKKIPLLITRHNAEFKKKNAYADLGVAVSAETMQYMNAKKNILITNGVCVKEPKQLDLSEKFTILAVGRLAPVKGFDLLLRALEKVNFDFKLIILGEGDERENLVNLAKDLNLSDKVKFEGFVNNVVDYVNAADLQVIASETEGLSIALIEAIFYAKILIASDVSNHAELIGKELVFAREDQILADKLTQIYENYDKFKEIFARVKAKKSEFSIEKMAQKYIDAYESLLK